MSVEARPSPVPPASAWRWINLPFLALLGFYRVALAPLMGGHCRFHPSCSVYAVEAFRTRNPLSAFWLTARRLLRCHPWGGAGYDPVPPVRDGSPEPSGTGSVESPRP
ncbi:MAG: membrane protein insertion efficiency factor YidD [Phycisphaerales bacterium]